MSSNLPSTPDGENSSAVAEMLTVESRPRRQSRELKDESAAEMLQRRRLTAVLDAVEAVERADELATHAYMTGEIAADARNVIVLTATQRAIRECYGLLMNHLDEREDEEERDYYWHGHEDSPLGGLTLEEAGKGVLFYGLRDVMLADEVYSSSWEERQKPRNHSVTVEQKSEKGTVPRKVSWGAYLRLREFLTKEVGLSLDAGAIEKEHQSDQPGL